MPFLIFFVLLFAALGLIRVAAAGLLAGTLFFGAPRVLDRVWDYKGNHCACNFSFDHP